MVIAGWRTRTLWLLSVGILSTGCSQAVAEPVPSPAPDPVVVAAPSDELTEPTTLGIDPAPTVPPQPQASVEPTPSPSPTPSPEPEPTAEPDEPVIQPLSDDDRGEPVKLVQARLTELGFLPGPIDGIPGRGTARAVEAFQEHAEVKVTGKVDADTVIAMGDDTLAVAVVEPGDRGSDVAALQHALTDGPFDAGTPDAVYGEKTVQAVYALEKLAGVRVDGVFDGVDQVALDRLTAGSLESAEATQRHDKRWVEVDLSRQLMSIYDPSDPSTPLLTSHVSSGNNERWCNDTAGCRVAATPTGSFTITRRIDGWRESSLDIGRLYNPLYFRGGIALHGAMSVPKFPASHGCVRVPMHIAEYLPGLLPNGTPVDVSW